MGSWGGGLPSPLSWRGVNHGHQSNRGSPKYLRAGELLDGHKREACNQLLKERAQYVGPRCVASYSTADIVVRQQDRPSPEAFDETLGVTWLRDGDLWKLRRGFWSLGLLPCEMQRDRFWRIYHFVHHTFPRIQFVWPNAEIEVYGRFRCGQCGMDLGEADRVPEACPGCGRFVGVSDGIYEADTSYLEKFLFLNKAYGEIESCLSKKESSESKRS
jgi:hypothetical protein